MRLSHILKSERIFLDLALGDADHLLRHLAQHMHHCHATLTETFILERLRAREQTGSTGLGGGVAIPHARLDSNAPPCAIFVRPARPVPFNAPDGRAVDLFFALAVPLHSTDVHLELLSEVAELFSDDAACTMLRRAGSAATVMEVLATRFQEIASP
jgi:nitrogen PTS system EIIA component